MSLRVNLVLPRALQKREIDFLMQEFNLFSIETCKYTPQMNPLYKGGSVYHIWTEEDDDLLGIASKHRVDTWKKNLNDDSSYRFHSTMQYQIDYSIYSATLWMHIIKTLVYDLTMSYVGIFLCWDQYFNEETHTTYQTTNNIDFQNIKTFNIHDISVDLLMDFPDSGIYYFEK